jgi:hypothetical protein
LHELQSRSDLDSFICLLWQEVGLYPTGSGVTVIFGLQILLRDPWLFVELRGAALDGNARSDGDCFCHGFPE